MTSLNQDFDAEAPNITTSGRYGQINDNDNNKLPLEIADNNEEDLSDESPSNNNNNMSLTEKYLQEKQQTKVRH